MPTATEPPSHGRRALLRAAAGLALVPASLARAAARAPLRLAAAWDDEAGRHFVGVVEARADALAVRHALEVPTRAHGLLAESDGRLVAVGRRPAEWLLRWRPGGGDARWWWAGGDRRLSGHVVALGPDRLATTEVDADTGAGLVALRDRATLDVVAEWPTAGADPHELLPEPDGGLVVANGGVATRPETGRAKRAGAAVDSSLVRLDADGRLVDQWRLADRWLSLRHLARHADGTLGIALQAEHDDDAARQAAPLLARLERRGLVAASQASALNGYGGSIVATRSGFAVSAPRADAVGFWSADGRWLGRRALAEACPLARADGASWAGGRTLALAAGDGGAADTRTLPAIRLDNHWTVVG